MNKQDRDQDQDSSETQAIGRMMMYLMWIVLIAMAVGWYFNDTLKQRHNPNQQFASHIETGGDRIVVLERNAYGHYVSSGKINGQEVQFFLDTGATEVSIPENIAEKLYLKKGAQFLVSTANGSTTVYATKIESIELGSIKLSNIPAHINPNMDSDDILLGMSFLKHLEFSQKGRELTLKQLATAP